VVQVLLPWQQQCGSDPKTLSAAQLVNTAAAKCPQPPPPCVTKTDFRVYQKMLTATCCNIDDTKCGVVGLPDTCLAAGCGEVLLPMQRQCADILPVLGFEDDLNALVLATCMGH
jgi:hypothetical protein